MRVLIFATAHNRHTERWCRYLAHAGVTVGVISDKPVRESFDYAGAQVFHPRWTFWQNLYVFKIRGGRYANNWHKARVYRPIVDQFRPDVIQAHDALVNGAALAGFPDYPRVLTLWGPDIELLGNPAEEEEKKRLVRTALQNADAITANAPGLQHHWSRLTGLPPERFTMFSWGTDTEVFRPRDHDEMRALRTALGLPLAPSLILSPRLAQPYYQIDKLIHGFLLRRRQARDENPNTAPHLVILRAGARDEDWRALNAIVPPEKQHLIHMLDQALAPEDLAALYSTSHAVAMIPRTDLLSMSLLECMACGSVPVLLKQANNLAAVAPWVPGAAELPDEDHGLGVYCEEESTARIEGLAEALGRAESLTADQRARIGDHNRRYVLKHHRWQVAAERMVQVFRAVMRRP